MGKKGVENFKSTLTALQQFLIEPVVNDRDRAGIIQAFEFTFEQCWKALQQESASQGITVASPKAAFSFAMSVGLIDGSEEKTWLEMLEDRNLTSHTYKKELAEQVLHRIEKKYLSVFLGLLNKLI